MTLGTKFPPTAPLEVPWSELVSQEHWNLLLAGREIARCAEVPVLVGGGVAYSVYAGRWRDAKDLDLMVRAADRERMIEALQAAGFEDYHSREAYDRSWIFRGIRDDVILDVIWDLPNHRVAVDDDWFTQARPVRIKDELFFVLGLEELIRIKLYVLQRDRCDWVDVLNTLAGSVERVDWDYLTSRMGRDLPLLQSVLALFSWLCPARVRAIPEAVRKRFAVPSIETGDAAEMEVRRARLFDSRPWFAQHQPIDYVMER
jgi:hypothetical protein